MENLDLDNVFLFNSSLVGYAADKVEAGRSIRTINLDTKAYIKYYKFNSEILRKTLRLSKEAFYTLTFSNLTQEEICYDAVDFALQLSTWGYSPRNLVKKFNETEVDKLRNNLDYDNFVEYFNNKTLLDNDKQDTSSKSKLGKRRLAEAHKELHAVHICYEKDKDEDGYYKLLVAINVPDREHNINIKRIAYYTTDEKDYRFMYSQLHNLHGSLLAVATLGRYYLKHKDEKPYTHHVIKKKNGKTRDIYAPNKKVKKACKDVAQALYRIYNVNNNNTKFKYQFAYLKGRGIINNLEYHSKFHYSDTANQTNLPLYFYKNDITAFFDNCQYNMVTPKLAVLTETGLSGIESSFDYTYNEERIAAYMGIEHILINPETCGLYQGNPASGILSNLILRPYLRYINNTINKYGYLATAYADDITVSSTKQFSKANTIYIDNVFKDILGIDFSINAKKSHVCNSVSSSVVGITYKDSGELTAPRKYYNRLRVALHRMSLGLELPKDMQHGKLLAVMNYCLSLELRGAAIMEERKLSSKPVMKFLRLAEQYKDVIGISNLLNSARVAFSTGD